MGVFDLFSKRQRRLRGEVPDVYTYDQIPLPLRVQIAHIWDDALGNAGQYNDEFTRVASAYDFVVKTLCREYGLFRLVGGSAYSGRDYRNELMKFLLEEKEVEHILDAVELSFRVIDKFTRTWDYTHSQDHDKKADAAIEELNQRFREHGVGYQFANGEIIRVDSELLHAEAVKPALVVLRGEEFRGAEEEFLRAFEHYRHSRTKEAVAEALKAFESTMKVICTKRGWQFDPNSATAKVLLDLCFKNGIVPAFWQQHFSALRATLESGVPTGRNRMGGHGQGGDPIAVPNHVVAYILHMTASGIVFLTESERQMP